MCQLEFPFDSLLFALFENYFAATFFMYPHYFPLAHLKGICFSSLVFCLLCKNRILKKLTVQHQSLFLRNHCKQIKKKKANIRSRGNILRYIMLLLYKDFGKKIAVIREKTEIERTWRKNCKISKTTLLHAQPQQEEQTLFLCRLVLLYKTLANHFWENFLVIQQRKTKNWDQEKFKFFQRRPRKIYKILLLRKLLSKCKM